MNMNDDTYKVENPEQPSSLTDWNNEPSVADLKNDLVGATSDHTTQVTKIDGYLDNLHVRGKAAPKKVAGKSAIQPKLIRKQAEWRYAALSEPFLSTEDLFNVSPVSYEDVYAAKQNQTLLNNQFNTKINKVKFIDNYVRAAVNEGTVICKVSWVSNEESVTRRDVPVYEYKSSINPQYKAYIETLLVRLEEDDNYLRTLPEHIQKAFNMTVNTGTLYEPVLTGYEDVTETKLTRNHPFVEVCDYRNTIVDPTCKGDVDNAKFVITSFETSLDELHKDPRYENLDKINTQNSTPNVDGMHDSDSGSDSFTFTDNVRKKLVAYEYWGYWDIDGTGKSTKPFVATWVGDTMIRMEESPYPDGKLPFVVEQYLPEKDELCGEPDGALLEDNQKVAGAVMRGMVDVMARSAAGQVGYRRDSLDYVNRKRFRNGESYEYNGNIDPTKAFHVHQYPELPQSAQYMLQLQNVEADTMTGVTAFGNSGLSGDALGSTATGVRGVLDAASKRELGILRRLANGITNIGRKFIAMNAEYLEEEEVIRVTNQDFVPVRRDDLAGNFDLKLTISTAEADNEKAQELAFMLQTTASTLGPDFAKMVQAEIADLRKMPALAHKIRNYEIKPDPLQQQLVQLQIENARLENAKLQKELGEIHSKAILNVAKAGTEKAKAGNLNSDTDLKDLDYIEQESGTAHARDVDLQSTQAKANTDLEVVKAVLNSNNTPSSSPSGAQASSKNSGDDPTVSNGVESI